MKFKKYVLKKYKKLNIDFLLKLFQFIIFLNNK